MALINGSNEAMMMMIEQLTDRKDPFNNDLLNLS